MKKALSFLLVLCLIITAIPFNLSAVADTNVIKLSADVQRLLYCPEDTVSVNINLSNNADGIAALRGKLLYDRENLTFENIVCNPPVDSDSSCSLSISHESKNGYIQILWDSTDGNGNISNYTLSGTIATVTFTVNKDAQNKDYTFDINFMDGTRYVFDETGRVPVWEYIDVETSGDTMTVNTDLPTKMFFDNIPTGAYAGETVTLDVALSGNEGMYIWNSKLHFDPSIFTVTNCVSANDDLNLEYNVKNGYINLLWDNKNPTDFTENTKIASITFAVAEDFDETSARFELEYVDAAKIDESAQFYLSTVYFNAFSCKIPLLTGERIPVNITLHRADGESETVERYAGETLILPDTNFVDKNWYTSDAASVEDIYNETICPAESIELYSSARAVDYSGNDKIVLYRYSQDFSVEKDSGTETLHFASQGVSEITRMFRLSKVEDNATYKLTVKYKASVKTEMGFGIAGANGNNMYMNTSYFEGDESTVIYNIKNTDSYIEADIYFTASLKGVVTDQSTSDDIKSSNGCDWAYLTLLDSAETGTNEIWISQLTLTKIDNAINVGGARLLTEQAYTAENKQAIRFHFSYNTVVSETESGENTLKLLLGDKSFEIVARGFLFRNGAVDKYADECDEHFVTKEGMTYKAAQFSSDSELIYRVKTENFEECWNYDQNTGVLDFSTYIAGYTEDMYNRKLMVRGFVTFKDEAGNEFTVYSSTINRSVNGMLIAQ